MLAQVDSAAILGIDAFTVQVEVDCAPGMDKYFIVGLPSSSGYSENDKELVWP